MLRSEREDQVQGENAEHVDAPVDGRQEDTRTKYVHHGAFPPVDVHGAGSPKPSASDRAYGESERDGGGGPQLDGPAHLRVTVSGLNVRSSPDKRGDNIIGGLHEGARVDAVGRESDWVRIHHQGRPAYVFAAFLALETPQAEAAPKTEALEKPEGAAASKDEAAAATAAKQHVEAAPHVAQPAAPHGGEVAHVAQPVSTSEAPHAEAKPDVAPAFGGVGHAGDAAALLATELTRLVAAVEQGGMDQQTAVETFVAADKNHHGGHVSATGTTMMTPLVGAVAAAGAAATAQKPVPAPATPAAATPAAPTARTLSTDYAGYTPDDTSYMHDYHHLQGGGALDDDAATDKDTEAPVLNKIRDANKKFEPSYLLELQTKLGVANKSGAFNTETLRKLRAYYKTANPQQKVDAHAILEGSILTAIVAGTPFREIGAGFGSHGQGSAGERAAGASKADAMAAALGYGTWAELDGAMVHIKLLDKTLGRGLPHLAAKVALADEWLRAHYPLPAGKDWKAHAKDALGWNYSGNAAYGDNANEIGMANGMFSHGHAVGAHVHSAGLALDIDVHHNPYVFAGDTDAKDSSNDIMAKHLRYAVQLYGGEAVSAAQLNHWSKQMSTEELFAKVDKASSSLGKYLDLATQSDEKIISEFETKAGFTHEQAVAVVPQVRHFGQTPGHRFFQDNVGRDEAHGLMTHSMPMLVALRDVAGLSWGGAEISEHGNNGDFMHFDCRNESIGQQLLAFGRANHGSDADHTPAAIEAQRQAAEARRNHHR